MMSATRTLAGLCLTATLVLLAGAASAQEKARRQPPQQVVPTGAEDSAQLTAEDEEGQRTIDAITSHSTEGLTFEERGDGTIGLDLQGRFMHVLTAATGEDGALLVSCHTGESQEAKANALPLWRPVRGQAGRRLNAKPLRAPLVVVPEQAPVLEEK